MSAALATVIVSRFVSIVLAALRATVVEVTYWMRMDSTALVNYSAC